MRFIASLLLLIVFVVNGFAQQTVTSVVVDASGQSIPGAHVVIENTYFGTVANRSGAFVLYIPDSLRGRNLNITSIGFKKKSISIASIRSKIVLEEDLVMLNAVEIIPRDYAREAVLNAIAAIPNNYPNQEERLSGFIREITYDQENGVDRPYYIAETVVESIKKPYEKKHTAGDVTIVEGRNFQGESLDTLRAGIYAGSHHVHRFDAVARREACLGKPDKYSFKIIDTIRVNNANALTIAFSGKNDDPKGELTIVDSTFAIVSFEIKKNNAPSMGLQRIDLTFKSLYDQGVDGKWRLLQTYYFTRFNYRNRILVLTSEYVTTSSSENLEEIPYLDQVHYLDHMLLESQDYDPAFWSNYNILLPDQTVDSLFATQKGEPKRLSTLEPEGNHRVRAFGGVALSPFERNAYQLNYSLPVEQLEENSSGSNELVYGLATRLEYKLWESLYTGLGITWPGIIRKNSILRGEVFLTGQFNLNKSGRPIYIMPSAGLGYYNLRYRLKRFQSEDFTWEGTDFENEEFEAYLGQKGFNFNGRLGFGVELGGKFLLVAEMIYYESLSDQAFVVVRERGSFLNTEKEENIDNRDQLDNPTPFSQKVSFNIGFYQQF